MMKRLWAKRWARLLTAALVLTAVSGTLSVLVGPQRIQAAALVYWQRALRGAGIGGPETESNMVYWCPMHPQIKRSQSGTCPICNMALAELEGGEVEIPDALTLTGQQVLQAAVATEPVVRRRLYREIDTTGRLDYDERLLANITSWIKGKSRIDKLNVNFEGQHVEIGTVMAELYSPQLLTAQQEYLIQLPANSSRSGSDTRSGSPNGLRIGRINLLESARQKLLYQGLTAAQINLLASTGTVSDRIPISAPISGTVIQRHVQEGDWVQEGESLFQVANLKHLWLFADLYEEELPLVKLGQTVTLSVQSRAGESFEGEVSFIDPKVQAETRTARVRIEVPNPKGQLMPGMYARVRFKVELPETLAVPAGAVLWSGQRRVVLVKTGEGTFEPREVRLGAKWLYPILDEPRVTQNLEFGADRQRYHQVLGGLQPGDDVVTAGAFLLNAESQFQSILTKTLAPASRSATLEEAIGEPLAERLRTVLDAYYKLSHTLADDELQAVSGRAESLAQVLSALAGQAEQEQASGLAEEAERLAQFTEDFTGDGLKNLHEARVGFGRISRGLVKLLAENGGQTLLGKDLFLFRCGMAKVGYENWLWWSREKLNPYMGKKMLDCGTQLSAFE